MEEWLDEETLRAMMRTAVKEGSPGDDKIRFVLHESSDETSCIASTRCAFEDTDKDKSDQ